MKFKVPGMMCMHCVNNVTETLTAMDGVSDVAVELATKTVSLTADEALKPAIIAAIEDLGFDVEE
ncbi:MAG: heavy-metal-associated domain-containing protein [Clostridia bacterium]|nr:heavy-metal-associated domain-containing protein [Clostridia bacterium]